MNESAAPRDPDDSTPEGGAGRAVVQFFLVPLLVVAVCVGVFFLFSLLTFEHKTPADYLADVRGGAASQRWQSAFELSRAVARIPPGPERQKLATQTLDVFERLHADRAEDRDVKRYLALVLGRLGDARAVPALERSAGDPDPLVRLYSVWALGMLGDRNAVPMIVAGSETEDAGARKMAAYVLGKLGDPRAVPRLTAMTADHAADVRWNAAIALAELRDPAGREVLHSMLDRASLARQAEGLSSAQAEEAIVSAAKAEAMIGDRDAMALLSRLADDDPSLKVRDAAREAMRTIGGKR
ncbi:MAG TPA: HEAT repeat domain-containing protein [Thermoanaerobaculia bacterium]|nr:HEAT repeat domain-containing protein [Thermoanaerobaculia bacterium]